MKTKIKYAFIITMKKPMCACSILESCHVKPYQTFHIHA